MFDWHDVCENINQTPPMRSNVISSFSAGFKPCISATTSLYFTFLDMHFKTILKRYFDATTCNVLLLLWLSSVWTCHALRQHSANGLEAWSTHCHHYIYCEDGADDFRSSLHAFYVDSIVSSSMCQLCYPEVFLCGFQQMFADLEPSLVGLRSCFCVHDGPKRRQVHIVWNCVETNHVCAKPGPVV